VGFWAIAAASFASSGYLTMRTLAQINDCMAEHSVDSIAKVGAMRPPAFPWLNVSWFPWLSKGSSHARPPGSC